MLIIKTFFLAVCLQLALNCCPVYISNVSAEAYVLMHEDGEIIFSHNADERKLIASTTKIMTAILAIENCTMSDAVEIKTEYCGIEGSSMYLKPGEKYTVYELLAGLMLVSGNDAALALAGHTAGTESDFVAMMNSKARELGLKNTHFSNPHGLNADGHYSTASDMAVLMSYCMDNHRFASLTKLTNISANGKILLNHNKLLSMYKNCIGGKTGYTQLAGRCLVSCAELEGTRFICVTLSAPDDWNDHIKLYEKAFSQYEKRDISCISQFEIPVISGETDSVVLAPENRRVFTEKDKELKLVAEMPAFVFAPINAGDTGGYYKIMSGDACIAEGKLIYQSSVELKTSEKRR